MQILVYFFAKQIPVTVYKAFAFVSSILRGMYTPTNALTVLILNT